MGRTRRAVDGAARACRSSTTVTGVDQELAAGRSQWRCSDRNRSRTAKIIVRRRSATIRRFVEQPLWRQNLCAGTRTWRDATRRRVPRSPRQFGRGDARVCATRSRLIHHRYDDAGRRCRTAGNGRATRSSSNAARSPSILHRAPADDVDAVRVERFDRETFAVAPPRPARGLHERDRKAVARVRQLSVKSCSLSPRLATRPTRRALAHRHPLIRVDETLADQTGDES